MELHPLVFMEVNEVEESTENMDICIVTWYTFNEKGLNVQRRFPMAARAGKFSNFGPISRSLLKETKRLLRQYDSDVKLPGLATSKEMLKSIFNHVLSPFFTTGLQK